MNPARHLSSTRIATLKKRPARWMFERTHRRARATSGCRRVPRGSQAIRPQRTPLTRAQSSWPVTTPLATTPQQRLYRAKATTCRDPFNLAKAALPCESPIVPRCGVTAQAAERGDDSSADRTFVENFRTSSDVTYNGSHLSIQNTIRYRGRDSTGPTSSRVQAKLGNR